MSTDKQKKRSIALRCGAMVGGRACAVRIRKYHGFDDWYVVCLNECGTRIQTLDSQDHEGSPLRWSRAEARRQGARWMRERAKPTPNTKMTDAPRSV